MRDIKFRAWDIKKNVMVCSIEQSFFQMGVWFASCRNGNCVLMQYTGLKDKNGVEIYEGDILKQSVSEYDLVKVYFANGMFMCESVSKSRFTDTTHWKHFHSLFYDEYYKYNNYKVIGNIYEHSHLLEQQ